MVWIGLTKKLCQSSETLTKLIYGEEESFKKNEFEITSWRKYFYVDSE